LGDREKNLKKAWGNKRMNGKENIGREVDNAKK